MPAKLEGGPVDHVGGRESPVSLVIPLNRRLLVQQMADQLSAPEGSGLPRRMLLCKLHHTVRGDARDPPLFLQSKEEPSLRIQVVIFQIQTLQPRIIPV